MPRPDLMPMTGGYRRTPTLQIGADIYCDTQIIIRELERRFPRPTLFPDANAGLPWVLGMWTDRSFFQNTVNLVFGSLADQVPKEFREDREQLRGQKFDVEAMKAAIPQMRDQLRAHVDWIEAQLGDGRAWLLGKQPSLGDVNAYMNIWYVRGNLPDAAKLFERFPKMLAWEQRVKAIGHGSRERELASAEALEIARNATPQTPMAEDNGDLNGRKPGDRVQVIPDDYGRIPVEGTIVSLSAQHIAIRRKDERAGEVVVHFPRAGFLVVPAG
jgi:glutathione S-transferase